MEHQERADELEREAGRMERESELVGGKIEEVQRDWEAKEQDQSVPGAQPDAEEVVRADIEEAEADEDEDEGDEQDQEEDDDQAEEE